MSYVIVSVISLIIGGAVGTFALALCIASKSIEETEKENECYGCFGASFGDCDHCPKNEGENDEE